MSLKAFLFTLTGGHGLSQFKLIPGSNYLVIKYQVDCGPVFGEKNELMVQGGDEHRLGYVSFAVVATADPSQPYGMYYGGPRYSYYKATGPSGSTIHPAGSSRVVPAEIEVFRVVLECQNASRLCFVEPVEAAGGQLSNALAQDVFCPSRMRRKPWRKPSKPWPKHRQHLKTS